MSTNSKKALKAGIWYTVVNFVTKAAVFLTTPIFTRIMTNTEIGEFANISAWFQVLVIIVTMDLYVSLSIARFDYKDEIQKYISSVLVYGSCITAVCYFIILMKMDFFCKLFSIDEYSIHIIFIYMLVYPSLQMYQSQSMFEYRYKVSALISIVSLIVSVGGALLMTIMLDDKVFGRVIGYYVPLTILCLVIYIYMIRKSKGISIKYFKYAFTIAFPMIWHSLSTRLLNSGDQIVITRYIGPSATALYSIGYTCSSVAVVLWTSMNSAWWPWSAEKMENNEIDTMKKASKMYVLFFSCVLIVMMLVTPELLWIMGGEDYVEAKNVLPPIIISCLYQFIYSLYVNIEFYLKKQKRIAIGTIFAAFLNILLNVLFVPRFGYIAAAYTTLVGYMCLLLFHYYSVKYLGKAEWCDNKYNWTVVVTFSISIPLMILLYKYNMVRYVLIFSLIICSLIVFVIKRESIVKVVKSILCK